MDESTKTSPYAGVPAGEGCLLALLLLAFVHARKKKDVTIKRINIFAFIKFEIP
jgi:hypothetical protein